MLFAFGDNMKKTGKKLILTGYDLEYFNK